MLDSIRRRATTVTIVLLSLVQLACGGAAGDGNPAVTNPPPSAPTTGTLVVTLQPSRGNGRDADGFSTTVDNALVKPLTYDAPAVTYDSLPPGDHIVRITGIAPQCSASADSITHTTKAGATDTVTIGMTCLGGFAYIQDVDTITTDLAYLTEDGRTIQLTSGPGLKFIESWSPDGTRLLYSQYENSRFHLHTVRADGTDAKIISSGTGNEFTPEWSPDGTHIAFQKGDSTGIYIAISDPDGTNVRPLAGTSSLDFDPAWSADGSRLYFGCDRFGRNHDLCTAALDGSDLRPIRYASLDPVVTPCTPFCTALVQHFATSPGGGTIAFEVYGAQGGEPERVWGASLDGTSAVPLSGSTISYAAKWSPSGDRVLLNLYDGVSKSTLATVKPDGSSYRQVASYDDTISQGDWSPDGTVIAYVDRTRQIGAMNPDGTNRRLITSGPPKGLPTWNPKARAVGTLSADRARPASPRVEQLPVLSRLRAEILRRGLHPRP